MQRVIETLNEARRVCMCVNDWNKYEYINMGQDVVELFAVRNCSLFEIECMAYKREHMSINV